MEPSDTPEPQIEPKPEPEIKPGGEPTSEQMPKPEPLDNTTLKTPKKFKKGFPKKWLLIGAVLALLVAGGAAAYFLVIKKDTPAQQNTTADDSETSTADTTTARTPVNVAYSFRTAFGEPLHLFYRPAAGGDRVDVKTLGKDSFASAYDVVDSNVAVAIDNIVYVSTDHGATYESAYSGETNSQITSVKFSANGARLAIADLADTGTNTIHSLKIDGTDDKELFNGEEAGIFIKAWDSAKQLMVYDHSCYGCDGGPSKPPVLRNLKDNTTSDFAEVKASTMVSLTANRAFDEMVYITATIGEFTEEGPGSNIVGPYTVYRYDIDSKKSTKLASFGTADKYLTVQAGYLADNKTPFYSYEKTLYSYVDGAPKLLYTSANNIWQVHFASDAVVIADLEDLATPGDFTVVSFDVATQTPTTIMQATVDTLVFGATTETASAL